MFLQVAGERAEVGFYPAHHRASSQSYRIKLQHRSVAETLRCHPMLVLHRGFLPLGIEQMTELHL